MFDPTLKPESISELEFQLKSLGYWTLEDIMQIAVLWQGKYFNNPKYSPYSKEAMEVTLEYLEPLLREKKLKVRIGKFQINVNKGETSIVEIGESYGKTVDTHQYTDSEMAIQLIRKYWSMLLDNKPLLFGQLDSIQFIPGDMEWETYSQGVLVPMKPYPVWDKPTHPDLE